MSLEWIIKTSPVKGDVKYYDKNNFYEIFPIFIIIILIIDKTSKTCNGLCISLSKHLFTYSFIHLSNLYADEKSKEKI